MLPTAWAHNKPNTTKTVAGAILSSEKRAGSFIARHNTSDAHRV